MRLFDKIGRFLLLLLLLCARSVAQTGYTIVEPLTGNQAGELVLGGNAYLTGGVQGDGWLRLTEAQRNQFGYAIINKSFPSTIGVEVDFEFVVWGGDGADGFSIFLFDARYDSTKPEGDPDKFRIGGLGGSLGYMGNSGPGLSGGYLGFGLDEWGNYSGLGGLRPGIGVRGPESSGYRWLGGNTNLPATFGNGFILDYKGVGGRPSPEVYYRRIFLAIDPIYENGQITHYELTARLQIHPNGDPVLVLDKLVITDMPPDFLKVGFAATTGANTNVHEVRNLTVTTPADIWVRKSVDKKEAYVGDELVYTIKMMNQFDLQADSLELRDIFPPHFQVEGITFTPDGKSGTEIVSGWLPGDLQLDHVILNLAPFSEAVFEVRGRVRDLPDDHLIVNTVRLDVITEKTGFSDNKEENNISLATTYIVKPEITTVADTFRMPIGLPLEDMNVLENDRVEGSAVDLRAVRLEVLAPAQPIYSEDVPYLDELTGDIVLSGNIVIGVYQITYSLCELANPNNCAEATVYIEIDPNTVLANTDDLGSIPAGRGGRTGSVLDNDLWNGMSVDSPITLIFWMDEAPDGVVFNPDGTIEVEPSVAAAEYTFHYRICELSYPDNCSEGTASFYVKNILDAQDDYYVLLIDRGEVYTETSVLDNDLASDLPIFISDVFLIPGAASHPNLTMDNSGVISIAEGTKVGRYTYSYTVCELVNPDNCQMATAFIDLQGKELFVPNIITPNDDGINDCFIVIGYENYDQIELLLFNRGGMEVYRNADYQNDWKGDGLGEDVYYYVLYLRKASQVTIHRGHVLLKRR